MVAVEAVGVVRGRSCSRSRSRCCAVVLVCVGWVCVVFKVSLVVIVCFESSSCCFIVLCYKLQRCSMETVQVRKQANSRGDRLLDEKKTELGLAGRVTSENVLFSVKECFFYYSLCLPRC